MLPMAIDQLRHRLRCPWYHTADRLDLGTLSQCAFMMIHICWSSCSRDRTCLHSVHFALPLEPSDATTRHHPPLS